MNARSRSQLLNTGSSGSLRGQPLSPTVRYHEGRFRNSRGQTLFYFSAFPESTEVAGLRHSKPRRVSAIVLFLHALGDHSRRYSYLYELLCEQGFAVIAYDLVGHGASDSCKHGVRAHADRFRYFVDDTNEFVQFAKASLLPKLLQRTESPPLVIAGSSYGSLVGVHTVLSEEHAFAGMCFFGPSLCMRMTPTRKVQAALARPLSALWPRARVVSTAKREWLCRDPGYFADFDSDPLTSSQLLTARMGSETLRAMRALKLDQRLTQGSSAFSQVPILFLVGSEDRTVCLRQGGRFFAGLGNCDKEMNVFRGLYHCLLEDPDRDEVIRHLLCWLKRRFP